jgi:hypothetical protein
LIGSKIPLQESWQNPKETIKVLSMQVNDQMDPEDLLGYASITNYFGVKAPHALMWQIFRRRLCNLDEIFGATRLLSKYTCSKRKVVDTRWIL